MLKTLLWEIFLLPANLEKSLLLQHQMQNTQNSSPAFSLLLINPTVLDFDPGHRRKKSLKIINLFYQEKSNAVVGVRRAALKN